MKVLIQSRKNLFSLPGGDTTQLLKTKEELEKLGVKVDINLDFSPDLKDYDLVHVSNITRIQETYLQVKNAVKQKKPIALSTIYWPTEEFEKKGQIGIRKLINDSISIDNEERIKAFARYIKDPDSRNEATKNLWRIGYTKMQMEVLKNANVLLPNSQIEMEKINDNYSITSSKKYFVVPNAIDYDIAQSQFNVTNRKFDKFKDSIVCVGRIEPRKNQLNLVKALNKTDLKLFIIGSVSKNQQAYFSKVKHYIDLNPNFHYVPYMENTEIYQVYKNCKVSALPSWYDTPGLVSLEAGVMGCNLAISSKGSTKEYFGKMADYCEPDDLIGIKNAVLKAYRRPKNSKLQQLILKKYTWHEAALQTIKGYKYILESRVQRNV